ncbi:sulfurtransferase-like selenium metabolism protein YedF [Geomonas nitrogeniifigens]|uniref:sulfurtransferase-like selenium metabolism protein YedF n=1 Tax=Geomonas diazotrophica TaxID=2843197 RepID=UPI001C2B9152|nr:sulfurtransferase-like selenium metabolism protein YedF [Geomonas nitrogeniifigens]QXE85909.1 sulfurtransferase-like selenium metabolism protein YedF [Geomonas nitrogeniifigens]
MNNLDVRGMACPLPVVQVKRALEAAQGAELRVLLDDGAPRENVKRFAQGRGYRVQEEQLEDGFAFTITGPGTPTAREAAPAAAVAAGPTVMLIGSDRMGDGPEDLGRLLMKNFIMTLLDLSELPDRIFFVNTGVLLAVEGSEVVETLNELGNRGVEVLSCGICLDFFKKKESLAAGGVTNMFTIAETMLNARSVLRP